MSDLRTPRPHSRPHRQRKARGTSEKRAMQKAVFVLLSKLSVKEEVNYTKD